MVGRNVAADCALNIGYFKGSASSKVDLFIKTSHSLLTAVVAHVCGHLKKKNKNAEKICACMFVESRNILMGALIRLLETSNWSLRGTTVSLTETSFPKKEKILSDIISCGHSKGN